MLEEYILSSQHRAPAQSSSQKKLSQGLHYLHPANLLQARPRLFS